MISEELLAATTEISTLLGRAGLPRLGLCGRVRQAAAGRNLEGSKYVAKIYEVRYKDDSGAIVCNQHHSEAHAKIDAKAISREKSRSLLGEVDYERKEIIRVCEFQGGVQGRWENRSGLFGECRVVLTLEDTKQQEPENVQALPKVEMSEAEIEEKRRTLERLRAAATAKETAKPERKATSPSAAPNSDKREKLIEAGHSKELVDCVCASNLHVGSPNYDCLVALWKGNVRDGMVNGLVGKALNAAMMKLRVQLVSSDCGKSIVTFGTAKDLGYKLIDYKLEIEEVA